MDKTVILLHGLGLNKWSMIRVASTLRKGGYRVLNLTYPSLRRDLAGIIDFVHERLVAQGLAEGAADGPLNFVTHSMGGLVARAYINLYHPNLGRVVMIAPPSSGNEIIDLIAGGVWWGKLSRRMIRKSIPTLTTRRSAEMRAMLGDSVDYPLGIIAGTTSRYAMGHYMLPHPNDGVVSVERAKLAGMSELIQLPGSHSLMLFRKSVAQAALHFLQHGRFA